MKTCAENRTLLMLIALGSLWFAQPSHAIFGLFSKDEEKVPTKEERAAQDREAAPIFAQADQWAKAGELGKATDLHKRIIKHYPYSQYAPESQFMIGEFELANGDVLKSFEAYQALIDRHRGSNRFSRALEQQYNIAVTSLTEKTSSLFGIKRHFSREKVVELFEQVITNAPSSIYASNSYYYIGRVHEANNKAQPAITAYQKVVDDFPNSEKAPQAQLRIGQLLGSSTPRPENPVNLRQSREAYEDFITNFPENENREVALQQLSVISEREARKSLGIAEFYEKQGNAKAAAIYYNDVLRSDNAALKQEARQRLSVISQANPEAMEMAKVDQSVIATPPHERLKNQDTYLGPPAPDLVAAPVEKPKMLTEEPAVVPAEEPNLPDTVSPDSLLNLGSLIPPAEPADGQDPLDFRLSSLNELADETTALEEAPEAPAPPTEEETTTEEADEPVIEETEEDTTTEEADEPVIEETEEEPSVSEEEEATEGDEETESSDS